MSRLSNLAVQNNGMVVETIPSYEVAKMMEREHKHVLKMLEGEVDKNGKNKIVGIIPALLREPSSRLSDYFIESTYKVDGNNKTYKCYECTKMGCELLAHKMTSEKGILFSARYVKKFNEMEKENSLNLTDIATNMNALFDYKAEQFTQKLMTQCKLQMSQMEHMIEMAIPKVIENIVDPMYKENHSLIEQNKELKKSASLVCLLDEFDKHKYLGGKYKDCCKITPIAYIYGFEPKTFNQLLRKLHILKGKPGNWELDDGLEVRTHAHKAIYQEKTYLVWTKIGIIEIYLTLAKAGIYPKE